MGHRQKGKHMKRRKSWHRGRVAGVAFQKAMRHIVRAERRATSRRAM